ncbi:Elongator complex protein 4 [Globomyces pollinis-pini]|nr:Elongator complex protein 4 [Globomyces pollinis-pini]
MGRVLLIKQDRFTGYANLLLKYFIAQGVVLNQSIALTNVESSPEDIMTDLMAVVEGKPGTTIEDDEEYVPQMAGGGRSMGQLRTRERATGNMNIAWRYQNLPQFSTALTSNSRGPNNSTYCHTFDLTKKIDTSLLATASAFLVDGTVLDDYKDNKGSESHYVKLLSILKSQIENPQYSASLENPGLTRKVLRIAIHSIGSPHWNSASPEDLYRFIYSLKALLRNTYAVAVITLPAYLYDDFYSGPHNPYIRRVEHASDAVLEVESFAGSPNPIDSQYTSDYHGLIHPRHLFQVDTNIETTRLNPVQLHSLGFKVRRKRFLIETFTLPPEADDDTDAKKRSGNVQTSAPGCGATGSRNPLDF